MPEVGDSALALLQTRQPSLDSVLATLINELSATPTELDLVLDDYHLIDNPDLQPSVAYLLEHLPPQVHLVISTRVDPALPLARLRARGELVEIRAADLRFTLTEVAAYLNDVAALELTPADIAALETRTEGWIAALQLAALSLRGRADAGAFIAAFAGDDRYIVDYLAEEVLDRQPPQVRDFLLQTSILDRLSGPLCEAVTGNTESQDMLEHLDRANLFLVPLDDTRRWYRYHHLFAEVLRPTCSTDAPRRSPTSTAAPAGGTTRRANLSPPCGTRSPPATSTGQPTSPSSPCPRCSATGRRRPSPPGSRSSRTRWCRHGPCWPSVSSRR